MLVGGGSPPGKGGLTVGMTWEGPADTDVFPAPRKGLVKEGMVPVPGVRAPAPAPPPRVGMEGPAMGRATPNKGDEGAAPAPPVSLPPGMIFVGVLIGEGPVDAAAPPGGSMGLGAAAGPPGPPGAPTTGR